MNDIVKCVAIDDEPLALDVIRKFCERMGGVELEVFSDPDKGLEYIRTARPDLVFLDIEMGETSGLDIAARLPQKTCFIFTTAYMNYALDGFDLDAVDYLHKPFSFARFRAAFDKALRRLGKENVRTGGQSIVVKQEYNNVTVPVDDILYIEAMEGYSKIFRVSGGCVTTRMILKNLSALLPPDDFIRIHRSFIVPRSKVKGFTRKEVTLTTGSSLPVGRLYASDIVRMLGL